MAVSSTLVVIGAQASFPIMWLGSVSDPWTTIPGVLATMPVLVFLFIAPIWPVHAKLRDAKRSELDRVQAQINAMARPAEEAFDHAALQPLLAYRREINAIPEWPFDLGVVTRLGLYLIIVPLTWIGAALIENLVDIMVG